MPRHIFDLLKMAFKEINKPLINSKIAILGYAYAGNSDDTRNTPTEALLRNLKNNQLKIVIQDPFVKEYNAKKISIAKALKGAQAIILMADHDQYKKLTYNKLKQLMKKNPIIIDGRNCFDKEEAEEAGFIYKGVGNI